MTRFSVMFAMVVFLCSLGWSQNPIDDEVITAEVEKRFRTSLKENQATYAESQDHLVRLGILADRRRRQIEISAVSSGLAEGAPTEFFLVGPNGKDYESLAVTMAKGSDLHEALTFLGLKPGRPTNFEAFQFWPKGERVNVFFEFELDGTTHRVRAEDMILDLRTKTTLPHAGMMFVGSTVKEIDGKDLYLADNVGDLMSDFNSPWTVLDIPYRAEQGSQYGSLVPNPKYLLKLGHPLKIIVKPQLPVDEQGVLDLQVEIEPEAPGAAQASDLRFSVVHGDKTLLAKGPFKAFLGLLEEYHKAEKDIYVKFAYSDQARVRALSELAELIHQLVDRKIIRIEAHPRHLYYEAFLPNKQWLDPNQRLMQPLELHLNASPSGHVMRYFDEKFLAGGETRLNEERHWFKGSAELMKLVERRERWDTSTLLFFVAPETSYGLLRKLYLEQRRRFPIAYVFTETEEFGE